MPIKPNFIERLVTFRLNIAPGPFLDVYAPLAYRAMATGLELGLFETLNKRPLSAAEVARQTETNERGMCLLLEALVAIGYVRKNKDQYENTKMTEKWLLQDSPTSFAGLMPHMTDVVDLSKNLTESIRQGEPAINLYEWLSNDAKIANNFHQGMLAAARISCDEIIKRTKLPATARKLIDLGGSHGLYSIRFCKQCANLSATVFDWHHARELAEETIEAEKMTDRVTFREGDFFEDDIDNGWDAALLFNIVHMHKPDRNKELFRKISAAMNQGGTVVIMDQTGVEEPGPMGRAFARLEGLNLYNALNAQTYPPKEIEGWLNTCGFGETRSVPLKTAPGFGLVIGTKIGV